MNKEKIFYVYALINPLKDSIFYIGKGKNNRMYTHEREAKKGINACNKHKHNTIRKIHSNDLSVKYKILYETDDENLCYEKEYYYIKKIGLDNLTNLTEGGYGGYKRSKETCDKISKSKAGIILTKEHRKNIGLAGLGRKQSKETKKKRSVSLMNHVVTKETREKISKANKGKKLSKEHCKNISKASRNRRWVTDEINAKRIKINDLDDFLNNNKNWKLGLSVLNCPFCNKSGAPTPMKRWHFDNCKQKLIC